MKQIWRKLRIWWRWNKRRLNKRWKRVKRKLRVRWRWGMRRLKMLIKRTRSRLSAGLSNPSRVARIMLFFGLLVILLGFIYVYFISPSRTKVQKVQGEAIIYRLAVDLYANVGAELLSLAATVLVIDRLNQRRATQQEKRRLILQMGSPDNAFAVEAARILSSEEWLEDGSLKKAKLRSANLQKARLWDADLQEAYLRHAILQDAKLRGANLQETDLQEANLKGAVLRDANLKGANLRGANLQEADLREADLQGIDLRETLLKGADLQNANLEGVLLGSSDLRKSNLLGPKRDESDLQSAKLNGACLVRANLQETDLWEAHLQGADLRDANLRGANLMRTHLQEADLRDVNLEGLCLASSDLQKANLAGANLKGAELDSANLTEANLDGSNLDNVKWASTYGPRKVATLPDGSKWEEGRDIMEFTHPKEWQLCKIEGIGPVIAAALVSAGIDTFRSLAEASMADLEKILKNADIRSTPSMTTWAEQAALAAKGNWDGLKKLQDELKGGRRIDDTDSKKDQDDE